MSVKAVMENGRQKRIRGQAVWEVFVPVRRRVRGPRKDAVATEAQIRDAVSGLKRVKKCRLSDIVHGYVQEKVQNGRAIETVRRARVRARMWVQALDDCYAHEVTQEEVLSVRAVRREAVSAAVVNKEVQTLKGMLRYAIRRQLWTPLGGIGAALQDQALNAVLGVICIPSLSHAPKQVHDLEDGEAMRALWTLTPSQQVAMCLQYITFSRIGTILSSSWGAVRQRGELGAGMIELENEKNRRVYKITFQHASRMAEWIQRARRAFVDQVGRAPRRTDPLVVNGSGQRWTTQTFGRAIKRRQVAAGIQKPITTHQLRHTSTTRAAIAGMTAAQLQHARQDKTRAMSERYTHMTDNAVAKERTEILENVGFAARVLKTPEKPEGNVYQNDDETEDVA